MLVRSDHDGLQAQSLKVALSFPNADTISMIKNRKLVAVVTPANETNRPGGTLWQSIGAWLEIRTQEGKRCFGPAPFNNVQNAQKQGEAMVAKWGEFGLWQKAG